MMMIASMEISFFFLCLGKTAATACAGNAVTAITCDGADLSVERTRAAVGLIAATTAIDDDDAAVGLNGSAANALR
jgi:hypothetical protein